MQSKYRHGPDIAEQNGDLGTPSYRPETLPSEGGLLVHGPDGLRVTAEVTSLEKFPKMVT